MVFKKMTATKCPSNELSLTNCVIVSPQNYSPTNGSHYISFENRSQHYWFKCLPNEQIQLDHLGFSMVHRRWANVGLSMTLNVETFVPKSGDDLEEVHLEIDFFKPKDSTSKPIDTDALAQDFHQNFSKFVFVREEKLVILFGSQHFSLLVSEVRTKGKGVKYGILNSNTKIVFQRGENSSISLTGKSQCRKPRNNIINPDFDFNELGIGGLDDEFKEIFRRAFSSRVLPPDLIEKMGARHVKGILLHGPPGCGKTLMARQIGKMLSAREPQVVNGPEILNKYVGESEANIRKLFEAAEEEQKRLGPNSGLHIIIFDEIDAICKQRGSVQGASGVHDTVVNQLLSKIDGVDMLNNILVIGMTNRPDLIDEALLRPGRLEVKKEISLPDEDGRLEILRIHTQKMADSKMIANDLDLGEIAKLTKNFSGAELAGLVGAAQSCMFVRHTKGGNHVEIDYDTIENIQICRNDFLAALENDIKPAYGSNEENMEQYMRNGILSWGPPVNNLLEQGSLFVNQVKSSDKTPLVSFLLHGPTGSGKTALATRIALDSGFPFVKVLSPADMVGMGESSKCQLVKKTFEDAYKSQLSCVVVDDIEKLMDYNPIGPRFSNVIAQALMVLFKKLPPKGRKLLVIATSSNREILAQMDMLKSFDDSIYVPNLSTEEHVAEALELLDAFSSTERETIKSMLRNMKVNVGIKHLIRMVGTGEQAQDKKRIATFLSMLEAESGLQQN